MNLRRRIFSTGAVLIFALAVSVSLVGAEEGNGGRLLEDYPSPMDMYHEIMGLEAEYPGLVEISVYGKSVQDRPLIAIHISRKDGKKRPEALVAGNIHGNEYIGNRLAMSVAERLASGNGSDAWIDSLLDKIDFWVIPCINPDGYVKTWEMAGNGPWPVMRKNAHGVDLNRNFPRYGKVWLPIAWAGSENPEHQYYRGTAPYSEPETAAIRDFVAKHRFFSSIDFHCWGGQFIPAKCPDHKCVVEYKNMARAFKSKQVHKKYKRLQFRLADQYTGEMEDMLYYEYGALAVCIELSTTANNKPAFKETGIKFWRNNPQNIDYWVENDRDASLAAIQEALQITGGYPEPPAKRRH